MHVDVDEIGDDLVPHGRDGADVFFDVIGNRIEGVVLHVGRSPSGLAGFVAVDGGAGFGGFITHGR